MLLVEEFIHVIKFWPVLNTMYILKMSLKVTGFTLNHGQITANTVDELLLKKRTSKN